MSKNIFTINCGSTSTKIALYRNKELIVKSEQHVDAAKIRNMKTVIEQLDLRTKQILDFLKTNNIAPASFDIIATRGGTLPPVKHCGAYRVNELMLAVLKYAPLAQHASSLSCMIGKKIAEPYGTTVVIYDPPSIDEADPIAKYTGIPEITNVPVDHPLNSRRVGFEVASKLGKKFNELNFIIAHLGGGISISCYNKGKFIDWIFDDEGPMSPQRAGRIPTRFLVDLCYSGKYTKSEMKSILTAKGGLVAYFDTQDVREIEKIIDEGNEKAKEVYIAMAYQVAKGIGEMSIVTFGNVDRIILTGGIAYSKTFTDMISERVSFIAPVEIVPGEMEMEALALGGLRVLEGGEPIYEYDMYPEGFSSIGELKANMSN